MIIAHITDFHIVPAPQLCYGFCNTRDALREVIDFLEDLNPRPDLVIASGDLVDEPTPAAYTELAAILARSSLPLLVIPGNHDNRRMLAEHLPEHPYLQGQESALNLVQSFNDLQIVTLSSVIPSKEFGQITDATLAWLEAQLANNDERPVMLVMHHPPIVTGLPFMDGFQPPYRKFAEFVKSSPRIKLIACGHVHRAIDGMLGAARVTTAPATGHQFSFTTDPTTPPRLSLEPPMVRLHVWNGSDVTSFMVAVNPLHVRDLPGMNPERWADIQQSLLLGSDRNEAKKLLENGQ
ncbi:3',5'-cyclic AMP phosphodiesterase CpdA [Burkholderia sp. D7]|nr:3',5'-cyclic AMP phosphodiesterase CpdA [Burkholderia sp. D7]